MECKDCKNREIRLRAMNMCPVCNSSSRNADDMMCEECSIILEKCMGCGMEIDIKDMKENSVKNNQSVNMWILNMWIYMK